MSRPLTIVVIALLVRNSVFGQGGGLGLARDTLLDQIPPGVALPIPVFRELFYRTASTSSKWANIHEIIVSSGSFRQLPDAEAFVKKMETDSFLLRNDILSASIERFGGTDALASELSLATGDRSFVDLERDLQKVAADRLSDLKELQRRLAPLKGSAIQTLVGSIGDVQQRSAALAQAQKAGQEILQTLAKPYLAATDLKTMQEQASTITKTLTDPAQKLLALVPNKEAELRAYYKNLADLSSGLNEQIGRIAPGQFPKLTLPQSVKLMESLGAIGNAHDGLISAISAKDKEGRDLLGQVQAGVKTLTASWDALPKSVSGDPRTELLVSGFRGFASAIQGEHLPGLPALASTLSAAGVFPQSTASALGQASISINALMSKKGDYANAAMGLLGTLSDLDAAHVPVPGIKQLAPVIGTATSILRAAGPLTTVLGFASGFSAFSMLGGLGGLGGGSDAAVQEALNQIKAKLDVMDRKLDEVLSDLRKLDDKITQYHLEEMHALEGLMFEAVRTHDLLAKKESIRTPCERAKGADESPQDRQAQLDRCLDKVKDTYAGDPPLKEVPTELSFEWNVRNYDLPQPLKETALDRLRQEISSRQGLVSLIKHTDCQGLMYPSSDLEELERRYNEYGRREGVSNCTEMLTGNLIEPGIMARYINWEQDALLATATQPQAIAIKFWRDNWTGLRDRLTLKELPLLNQAIAQQSGISGDLLIPELSELLDKSMTDEKIRADLHTVWSANGLLAENIARYWVWKKIKDARRPTAGTDQKPGSKPDRWLRTLYAFAWESGDESYWRLITRSPAGVTFMPRPSPPPDPNKTPTPKWTIQFPGLDPVSMPEPASTNLLELRWPTSLSALVQARERVLEMVSGTEYVQKTWTRDARTGAMDTKTAKDLLEAFATAPAPTSVIPRTPR